MPPTATLERSPELERLEETRETSETLNFGEVLTEIPENISELDLDEIIEIRNRVVDKLIDEGISTKRGIEVGEKHAKEKGVVLDNAGLLNSEAHEIKDGKVRFKPEAVQELFDNWHTRIGEATQLAGDQLMTIKQEIDAESGQFGTAVGGSADMLIRGLDMTIALAEQDARFLPEVQRSLAEARNEIAITELANKYSDREFVVFESSPFAHKLLEESGDGFARRRYYDPDSKTAMHRTHVIKGNDRSYTSTPIEDDSLELWDRVYGSHSSSDADRLGSLVIVDVTNRNIDLAEVHVMAIANIDQAQAGITGETTFAGRAVKSQQVRQELYDKALEKAKSTENNAIDNAYKMTQLSIQIAESLLTGKISGEVKERIAEALSARTTDNKPVLGKREQHLFKQALNGDLNERSASVLQELVVFQESARSTTDTDRLASLLGAEQAAVVASGGDLESAALTSFASGNRAGGCPGADEETISTDEKKQLDPLKKSKKLQWEGAAFKLSDHESRQFEEIVLAEQALAAERRKEEQVENVNILDLLSINLEQLEGSGSGFGYWGESDSRERDPRRASEDKSEQISETEQGFSLLDVKLTKPEEDNLNELVGQIQRILLLSSLGTEHEVKDEEIDLELSEMETSKQLSGGLMTIESLTDEPLASEVEETASSEEVLVENPVAAYEVWLTRLMQAVEATTESADTPEKNTTTEEIRRLLEIFDTVAELSESQTKFEKGFDLMLAKFKVDLVLLLDYEEEGLDREMIDRIIETLNDPEAREEIVQEIAESMRELDVLLVQDLFKDEISEDVETIIIQMLNMEQVSEQTLFTEEEIDKLVAALDENRLDRDTIYLIRKFVLYQQLEILIPDEALRARLVNGGQAQELLELVGTANQTSNYLVDKLIKSAVSSRDEEDERLGLKQRLGMFIVACCSLSTEGIELSLITEQYDQFSSDQLVFA